MPGPFKKLPKSQIRKEKPSLQNGAEYLQIMCLLRDRIWNTEQKHTHTHKKPSQLNKETNHPT